MAMLAAHRCAADKRRIVYDMVAALCPRRPRSRHEYLEIPCGKNLSCFWLFSELARPPLRLGHHSDGGGGVYVVLREQATRAPPLHEVLPPTV